MKRLLSMFMMLFVLSACAPQSVIAPVEPPVRLTSTPFVLSENPVPTRTPYEQVVTMVPEETQPAPDPTLQPTSPDSGGSQNGDDLKPLTFDSLEMLAIPHAVYQDPHAGFAFDYPSAWEVSSPADAESAAVYVMSVISYARVTPGPRQQEGIPEGHAKIEVIVFQDQTYTFQSAVESQRTQAGSEMINLLLDEGWQLPSGLPAQHWITDGFGGPVSILITAIDGRKIIVAGYGESGLFIPIAGSLRPLTK